MRYVALLGANAEGGKVSATERGLVVAGATAVTLIVSAGTDWQDEDFAQRARRRLDAAIAKPFDRLLEEAAADHRRHMERCQLALPQGPTAQLPTPERVGAGHELEGESVARALRLGCAAPRSARRERQLPDRDAGGDQVRVKRTQNQVKRPGTSTIR
jgi:hypothetical protein